MTEGTRPDSDHAPGAAGRAGDSGAAKGRAAKTRNSAAFRTLLAGAIVLALLLIFILENTQDVKVSYLGTHGHLPLGVALLLAAVAGAILIGLVALVRILQLRRRARRRSAAATGTRH
jgi:uncharacterized integral membrane protein